jgi:hypothetical protein
MTLFVDDVFAELLSAHSLSLLLAIMGVPLTLFNKKTSAKPAYMKSLQS